MGGPGPTGTSTNSPRIDTGTKALTGHKPPGTLGITKVRTRMPHFIIHLDLKELIEIDEPGERISLDRKKGIKKTTLFKGKVIQKDSGRPKAVLAIVKKKFKSLHSLIRIELGSGSGSNRFLKARFGWPLIPVGGKPIVHKKYGPLFDPAYVGAGAEALSRTRMKPFKPLKGDPKKGVTAYIFEGAIGYVILDFFSGKPVKVNNIFATAIVHELGHNLGLPHTSSAKDIMFVYAHRPEKEQRQWMVLAEKGSLGFNATQLASIRKLLKLPAGIKP